MRNAVLHLITNKASNFGSDLLPSYSSFYPYTATPAEEAIRTLLKINDGLYYLKNSLIAVYAFPEILAEFRETSVTYDISKFMTEEIVLEQAEYYNTSTSNFSVTNHPSTFPDDTYCRWRIKYVDGTNLLFLGCNAAFTIPYNIYHLAGNRVAIDAEWPAISGLKGGFKLAEGTSWATGTYISMYAPPASFPYTAAVNLASNLPGTARLLAEAGIARNFSNAQSGIEKYALLMLALARPDIRNVAPPQDCSVQ